MADLLHHEADRFSGERKRRDGAHREDKQRERVIVSRDPVHAQVPALPAPVYDGPFPFAVGIDRQGFHVSAAERASVARRDVDMTAPQAVRAVVALSGSARSGEDCHPAMSAYKRSFNNAVFRSGHTMLQSC